MLSPVLLARVLGVDRQSSICAASEQADLPDLSKQNDVLSSVMSLCADRSPSLMKRQAHLSPLVTDSAFNIDKLHFGLHNGMVKSTYPLAQRDDFFYLLLVN